MIYNQVKEFIVSLSMREKILIMLAVGFIVGFLIFLLLRYGLGIGNVVVEPIEKNISEITFEKYKEDIKSADKKLIYVDNTTLSTYAEFRPTVDSMLINRSIEVSFLDLSKVTEDELINFMNQTEVTKDSYMLPLLLVVENT